MIEVTDGFVATVGDAVVGWANLDGDEVAQLSVDPDAGGQGVARRLYETIEALALAKGLDQPVPGQAAVRRDVRGRDVAGPDHNQAGRR